MKDTRFAPSFQGAGAIFHSDSDPDAGFSAAPAVVYSPAVSDEEVLGDLARKANDCFDAAVQHGTNQLLSTRAAGEHLAKAKSRVKHGEWMDWCRSNLRFSIRKADVCMEIHREWDSISARMKSHPGEITSVASAMAFLRQQRDEASNSQSAANLPATTPTPTPPAPAEPVATPAPETPRSVGGVLPTPSNGRTMIPLLPAPAPAPVARAEQPDRCQKVSIAPKPAESMPPGDYEIVRNGATVRQHFPANPTDPDAVAREYRERLAAERAAEDALDDQAWLRRLPAHSRLEGRPLELFEADAVLYRRMRQAIGDIKKVAAAATKPGYRRGKFGWRLYLLLSTEPPDSWEVCADEPAGCGGTGRQVLPGEPPSDCPTCDGRGYKIPWAR